MSAQLVRFGPYFLNGDLVTNPKLYHFEPGSTQTRVAWTDYYQAVTAHQPILGDQNGQIHGYFSGLYKFEVRTNDDVTVLGQWDNASTSFEVDQDTSEYFLGPPDANVDYFPVIASIVNTVPSKGSLTLEAGIYKHSNEINLPGFFRIQGAGMTATVLKLTANAALRCGIRTTVAGLDVRDLSLETDTPLTTNLEMSAVRCDLFGTTVASGQRVTYENVRVRGYNIGLYADGDTARRIDKAIYRNVDVQCSGPASDYVASCLHMHRVMTGEIDEYMLDKNHTGEHGCYFSEVANFYAGRGRIRNATRGGAWGFKMVSDVAGQEQSQWTFDGLDVENCTAGMQTSLFQDNSLGVLNFANLRFKSTGGVTGQDGTITVDLSDTSRIRSVRCSNISLNGIQQKGFAFQGEAGTKIDHVVIDGVTPFNWSTSSTGAHALIGSTGTTLDLGLLEVRGINADGNSNGRTIFDSGSMQSSVKRLVYEAIQEVNTTARGWPFTLEVNSTTPSLRLGNTFYVNNSSPTLISSFLGMVPGERYTLIFSNGNTTLDQGTNIKCPGAVDLNPGTNDVYGVCTYDGTVAIVSGGSNN